MKYPEEIYQVFSDDMSGRGRRLAYNIGCARGYEAGKAEQSDPLAGYSNLTEAIKSKQPIDWERLDGLKVQCVNPELRGEIHGTLKRDPDCLPDVCGAWWDMSMDDAYTNALVDAWYGKSGWTLYVEGEIPLRRKTADQLPLGMCFEGEYHNSRIELAQVIANRYGKRLVTDHEEKNIGGYAEKEVEVIKEYGIGTFQKPEGK